MYGNAYCYQDQNDSDEEIVYYNNRKHYCEP